MTRCRVLVLAVALAAGVGFGAGNERPMRFSFGGVERTCRVRLPAGHDSTRAWPLVLVLHGRGGTGRSVERLTGMSPLCESAGLILAYPDARGGRWNDGRQDGPDDVGFLIELVGRIERKYGADPKRVYATGMSNGAMMCYRLGCERARVFAAIAPVGGAMPRRLLEAGRPDVAVPVLAVNGTRDPLVRFEGGKTLAPVRRTVDFWVAANGCNPMSETLATSHAIRDDSTVVVAERWSGADPGREVLLYTVIGGGHTWPSGEARPARFGARSRELDASRTILDFFRRHRR